MLNSGVYNFDPSKLEGALNSNVSKPKGSYTVQDNGQAGSFHRWLLHRKRKALYLKRDITVGKRQLYRIICDQGNLESEVVGSDVKPPQLGKAVVDYGTDYEVESMGASYRRII